jgi:hypothetical protein
MSGVLCAGPQVQGVVQENEALHARTQQQAALLEGKAALAAAAAGGAGASDAEKARLQVRCGGMLSPCTRGGRSVLCSPPYLHSIHLLAL